MKTFAILRTLPRSGTTMQKERTSYGTSRFRKAREIKPGYPWVGRFTDEAQLAHYLAVERITCLECGKTYRRLEGHLRVHAIDASDYKAKFGIPQSAALVCQEVHERLKSRADFLRGIVAATPIEEMRKRGARGATIAVQRRRNMAPLSKSRQSQNGKEVGEKNLLRHAPLTEAQRAKIAASPKTIPTEALAREYGVTGTTITKIRGKRGIAYNGRGSE